jgi:hypothetical protein
VRRVGRAPSFVVFMIVAVAAAIVAVLARTPWRQRAFKGRQRIATGDGPRDAVAHPSEEAAARWLEAMRCACGRRASASPAGEVMVGDRRVVATKLECESCGRERRVFHFIAPDEPHP